MVELLGLPPKDMIEMSRNKDKYFAPVYDVNGEYTYRFKTVEEFQIEQNIQVPYLNFQETLTCLDDLVAFQGAKGNKKQTKECFTDFCKGVLQLDPRKRWTPHMATQHPFISRNKYEGPFKPTPEVKSKPSSTNVGTDEDEGNSDSSSVSRRNRSDEMYEKLGSCPSQILRDPSDSIFNKFAKKDVKPDHANILLTKSYRPPILSLEIEYFKGFNLNSLDSIFEDFKTKVTNHSKPLHP